MIRWMACPPHSNMNLRAKASNCAAGQGTLSAEIAVKSLWSEGAAQHLMSYALSTQVRTSSQAGHGQIDHVHGVTTW